jgi:hypothetical protein
MKSILLISGLLSLTIACSTAQTDDQDLSSTVSPVASPSSQPDSASFETMLLPISTQSTLAIAIVEADQKYHIWMEGRSGILRVDTNQALWLEQGGISLGKGSGQQHLEIDGHDYFTFTKPSKVAIDKKMTENPKNNTGLKVTLEMTGKGKYITQVVPQSGRTVKVSSSIQKPVRTTILQVANKSDVYGAPTPILTAAQKSSATSNHGVPKEATVQSPVSPSTEQSKKFTTELQAILGSGMAIGWSSMVNLDRDEAMEALICVTEPSGKRCYVWDTVNNEERYYSAGLKWDQSTLPKIFTLNNYTYVGVEQKMQKSSVFKALRFDGSGYDVDRL